MIQKNIFDCHTHTHFSHDSECDLYDSLRSATQKGLAGFAVTDHCDIEFCMEKDVKSAIMQSADCAHKMGRNVLTGVEIGEGIWNKKETDNVISGTSFDIVLMLPAGKFNTVDTTGAGDIFFGTFLSNWIKNKSTLDNITTEKAAEYLKTSIYIAGKSTEKHGGIASIPDIKGEMDS